jgi:hypothetical protein
MTLFEELKRRNVIRMAGAFTLLVPVHRSSLGTMLPAFDFRHDARPSWCWRWFVPAMVFSWVFD